MLEIYIDADACPVKEEAYKVAKRYGLKVYVVANQMIRVPQGEWVEGVLVPGGFDAADDWIVEHAQPYDILISSDLPLCDRCIQKGVFALGPKGQRHTEESIADALATRNILEGLRDMGQHTGGPAPYQPKDRSRFLSRLDEVVQAIKRIQRESAPPASPSSASSPMSPTPPAGSTEPPTSPDDTDAPPPATEG